MATDNTAPQFTISDWSPDWEKIADALARQGYQADSAYTETIWADFQSYHTRKGTKRAQSHWHNSFLFRIRKSLDDADADGESVAPPAIDVDSAIADIQARVEKLVQERIEGEVAELRTRIRALEILVDRLEQRDRTRSEISSAVMDIKNTDW